MSKFFYTLTAFCIISLAASAQQQQYVQPNLSRGIHPGTVTTLDNQVLQGYVYFDDVYGNQKKCVFYTDYNDRKTEKVYKPNDIAAYTIENLQYKSIAYSGNIGFGKSDKHFLFIAKPGAVTTYVYWAPEQQMVWQKGDDEPVSNASMLFNLKKNLTKLVGDDPDLATIIETKGKVYLLGTLDQMVDQYNTWAQSKKQ